ncbi:MAG: hypothetical protein EA420_20090 [Candidatus Competibacteraceae bacterium]|nr:MAG: hypothetical protein EA420_20090 [Candidatus Competibacteraceae bacterium]
MKAALLVLLAGVALSAGAKPGEVRKLENMRVADQQNGDLIVVARRGGFAGTVLGPTVDVPISCAEPKGT